jgi:Ca-activated chloride channel homolog
VTRVLHWARLHVAFTLLLLAVLALGVAGSLIGWDLLWATPDQRGAVQLRLGHDAAAADAFLDPVWRGVALMRNGEFREAADSFAQSDLAEAQYNRGNALIMLGAYPDAIAEYDGALTLRPDWPDAVANRKLALLRAKAANPQSESEETMLVQAEEKYDRNRPRNSDAPPDASQQSGMSDTATRSLWLLRVQTKPGDFLRARFSYQLEHGSPDGTKN